MHYTALIAVLIFLGIYSPGSAWAKDSAQASCLITDRICVLKQLEKTAADIENKSWRDQTYRELAKTYAFERQIEKALSILPLIETPDTRAMAIRGIGMAAAGNDLSVADYTSIFKALRAEADKIKHPPSYAIALTYIAMSQAFAGDNEGAWATAADMENAALRHKAYAETAEIQAEREDFKAAMTSIAAIESEAFRNKAYRIVSKLLAGQDLFAEAFEAAQKITNAYKKSTAIQYILDQQKPRDVKR